MAAAKCGNENVQKCVTEKNSPEKSVNNNFRAKGNCKDLLKVSPGRELDIYLLEKNKKVDAQRKTFKPSACEILKQVKDFLPMMKQAQEELSSTTDHNIENIDEDGPCINMDIQLVELDNEDGSSESDLSEELDSDIDLSEVNENNMVLKKPEKIKKPLIEDIT